MRKEAASAISRLSNERGAIGALSSSCPPCKSCPRCDTPIDCPKVEKCPTTHAAAPSHSGDDDFTFKIYVYDREIPEEFHRRLRKEQSRCVNDQYGTEIRIHEELLKSPIRTLNPEEADFFYVPIYGECYLFRENSKLGSKEAMPKTNRWYKRALSIVRDEYPYWNRTQGRDHIWTFPGARGPHIFKDWKRNIKKSIFLTPEGDRSLSEQFNTWKDVVIPGLEADEELWSGQLRKESIKRDIFAFFKGTIHNRGGKSYSRGLRIVSEDLLKHEKDVVFGEQTSDCNRKCYKRMMRRSIFCLCPRGWSPWTLRAYQAMMVGW